MLNRLSERTLLGLTMLTLVFAGRLYGQCNAPDSAKQAEVTNYVVKRYQLPSTTALTLTKTAQANTGCFWELDYAIGSSQRPVVLYLSPDGRYLAPTLFDMRVDPLEEAKARDQHMAQDLLAGVPVSRGAKASPATVTIVEFSDFQCPYCRRMTDVLEKEVLPREDGRVRLVFRNFPLPMHPWAKDAAEIATCASLQSPEAFWIMHDFFFNNQTQLHPDTLRDAALQFASNNKFIDQVQLKQCVDRELGLDPVMQDQQMGQKIGVRGTPTLFVNGVRFDGLRTAEEMESIIDRASKGQLVGDSGMTNASVVRPAIASSAVRANQCDPTPRRSLENAQ